MKKLTQVVSLAAAVSAGAAHAVDGDVLTSFASPTQFPTGQAWIKNYLYLLDRSGKVVHKIDPATGQSVYSFPTTHVGDLTNALNFIWISDPIKDEIVKVDPVDGQVLKTLASPGAAPAGLAFDGNYLWNVDWMDNVIYKISPVDGAVLDSFASPSTGGRPFGLTWDGQSLWMVDWQDDTVYQIDIDTAAVLKTFPAPGPNSQGLAWDGKYLWVSDYDTDTIYKVDSGATTPGVVGCIEVEGHGLVGEVTLSQTGQPGQQLPTEDGCFAFAEIRSGIPVQINVTETETGPDVLAPVITLLGDADMSVELGAEFSDPGATAQDNVDGDISSSVTRTGVVDTSTLGDYTLSYDVTDNAGNVATTVVRTVHVVEADVDSEAPVITLNGAATESVEVGSTYTDPGATASDNVDGDISAQITVTGEVNTAQAGTYTLTYDVADLAGNAATTVTRTVNVVAAADTTAPVISLLGNNPVQVEQGSSYSDAGATASDNVDGNLTSQIVVSGGVDTAQAGSYTINYNVADSSGNPAATVSRTVNVVDTTAPVITVIGDNPMTVTQNTAFVDPGVFASDSVDGDISGNVVATGTVNTAVVGSYTRIYNVSDAAGNPAAQKSRTVNVVLAADTTAPVISLVGANPLYVEQGSSFSDPGVTANDDRDGNVSSQVVSTGTVNSNVAGSYIRRYNVSDSAGNAATEVTRSVVVRDTTRPIITLVGSSPVTVAQYSAYSDAGATASDNIDGNITANIARNSNVNTNVAGSYSVTYNVADQAGNSASTVTRTVNVVFECRNFTATNSAHESAGRAYSETTGFWFWQTTTWYATGSGNSLGTSGSTTSTLSESPEGYFSNGACN